MTWKRLESTTIDGSLLEGEAACIADPLWLLGRQWQVGEFTGEDAASPLVVEAAFGHAPLSRVRLGPPDAGGPVTDRLALPLETAVEREAVGAGPAALRLAAEAGLELRRELLAHGAPAGLVERLPDAFPLVLGPDDGLDPVGDAELVLLARRAPDARAVLADLAAGGAVVAGLPGAHALQPVFDAWREWYAGWCAEPTPGVRSWNPQRMEYRFQVAAGIGDGAELQLDAEEYAGGRLDWYAFDVAADGTPALGARGALERREVRVLPTPARFAGQAASRWWQLEDAAVWFGDLGSAPEDLARVAVAGFGTVFGDDWYLVPCRLPTGTIVRATTVNVLDCFGEEHTIRSCAELDGPDRVWRFFELTGDGSADAARLQDRRCPWLLLAPAVAGVTQSQPVEEVALLRDEAGNLGWAAELRVESTAGRTIDRAARARAAAVPLPPPADDAWGYRLAVPVPAHLVPLVPVRSLDDGVLYLQRGHMEAAEGETTGALGRVLEPESALLIDDAEVPATGARVTRSWQLTRTADGGVVLWVGRRKDAGPPRRSPGLRFDELTPSP